MGLSRTPGLRVPILAGVRFGVGQLGVHGGEAGIGAVLTQAETVLMAEQLAIAEDERVALGLGPAGPGVDELGGHGCRWCDGTGLGDRAGVGRRADIGAAQRVAGAAAAGKWAQNAALSPSLGMKRSASLTLWSSPRLL